MYSLREQQICDRVVLRGGLRVGFFGRGHFSLLKLYGVCTFVLPT